MGMITTTAPAIQLVDWLYPSEPIRIDKRPILCRGVGCNCRSYVRYDHIAGWDYCVCKHSSGTHKKPGTKTQPAKKARRA